MSFEEGFEYYGEELVFDSGDRDFDGDYDEDDIEIEDYNEEVEEEDIDLNGDKLNDDGLRQDEDEMKFMDGNVFGSSYNDRERLTGPITSVAQIKSLINVFGGALGKKDKLSFSDLTDEDIFKLLLNNVIYSNKLNNYYPTKNFTTLMEELFLVLDKVPNLKYKNPVCLFISYLCISKKDGEIIPSMLKEWKKAIVALNLYCIDIIRYCRLWKNIYKK